MKRDGGVAVAALRLPPPTACEKILSVLIYLAFPRVVHVRRRRLSRIRPRFGLRCGYLQLFACLDTFSGRPSCRPLPPGSNIPDGITLAVPCACCLCLRRPLSPHSAVERQGSGPGWEGRNFPHGVRQVSERGRRRLIQAPLFTPLPSLQERAPLPAPRFPAAQMPSHSRVAGLL